MAAPKTNENTSRTICRAFGGTTTLLLSGGSLSRSHCLDDLLCNLVRRLLLRIDGQVRAFTVQRFALLKQLPNFTELILGGEWRSPTGGVRVQGKSLLNRCG